MGVSMLDMLRAIADGENDPEKLASHPDCPVHR